MLYSPLKNIPSNDSLVAYGIALFVVTATISNIVTTNESYAFVTHIRSWTYSLMLLVLALLLMTRRVAAGSAAIVMAFLTVAVYGALQSVIFATLELRLRGFLIDITIIIAGFLLLIIDSLGSWRIWLSKFYVLYAIAVFILTVLISGITFEPLPKFVFDYGSDLIGRQETYSLGISFFYGLGSIAAFNEYMNKRNLASRAFYLLSFFLFLFLCSMGGGRGEILAALLTLLAIAAFSSRRMLFVLITTILSLTFLISLFSLGLLREFVIFDRFVALLDGDMSYRDVLLGETVNLINDNPICLISGCGFLFFQSYLGYEEGMYPHNSLVEATIVFGLPFSLLVIFLIANGIRIYYARCIHFDFIMATWFFTGLVSLKSNYLLGNWILLSLSVYFMSIFINQIYRVKSVRIQQPSIS
jgi:hypothetical protein